MSQSTTTRSLAIRFSRSLTLTAVLALTLAACDDDPTAPALPTGGQITVDASQGPAYVSLGDPPQTVTPADPSTSTAWDLAFTATAVTLNGGQAGPGGVRGFCLCANANVTNAEVQAFTPANQLAAYDAVTVSGIPADNQFRADTLSPAVSGWFTGTPGSALTPVAGRSFILRTSGAAVRYAKFRVTAIQNSTATSAGQVTIEYAVQPASGQAFNAPTSVVLDGRTGPVAIDFETGTTGAAPTGWDIKLDGFAIRANSGVSASAGGSTAALPVTQTPFPDITYAFASSAPAVAFRSDTYAGVFAAQPWYRYNITGTDNQIWPVFNVYLIRKGSSVWKVQITGYYNATAQPRFISFRYQQLR